MRAGLIVNPKSGKSSGKGLALAAKLRAQGNVTVRILGDFNELSSHLADCAGEGVTDLFISSGDGTIQAIQTELAEHRLFPAQPRLCLLPHGTTNMTAADLGFSQRNIDAQSAFIAALQPKSLRSRPTLRAANPRDGKPRHGMFLGTGAVSEAALYCQKVFNANGVKGNWATFATLASAASRTIFTAPNPDDPNRFDRPFDLAISADGREICSGRQLMMLATTLQKLILGARPFWGGSAGPIRMSVLPYPVPNLFRWLLPIMYGSENRTVPAGAISVSARMLDVGSRVPFVIDGEFFEGPEDGPLRIETGPDFTYICG